MASGVLTAAFRFLALAIHWLYATIVAERNLPSLSSKLVPAPGFEPGTIGLKVETRDVFWSSLRSAEVHFVFRTG